MLTGKRGVIMGVANDHSIAWGVASALHAHGAQMMFTAQEVMANRVAPLAAKVGADLAFCDVEDEASVQAVIDEIGQNWGKIDFLVHSIAWSERSELRGRYVDTSRDNFSRTMVASCFSFTEAARVASKYMKEGGSLLTLTFDGARRAYPGYHVMGLAKAALESSVRYMAVDFGGSNIRVNAISAGPMRTLAGSGISSARKILQHHRDTAPLGRSVTLEDIGGAAAYLISDLSSGVTGEVHFVDAGCNITAMPHAGQ